MAENTCVCCGASIPEGRQVCLSCERIPQHTMADLVWVGVREFQSIGTGKFFRAGNGRMKEETRGVEFVNTVGAGRMTLEEWYAAMEEAVIREEKTAALDVWIEKTKSCAWLWT